MSKITESQIEEYAIELLEAQGFSYIYGLHIAPDSNQTKNIDVYRKSPYSVHIAGNMYTKFAFSMHKGA